MWFKNNYTNYSGCKNAGQTSIVSAARQQVKAYIQIRPRGVQYLYLCWVVLLGIMTIIVLAEPDVPGAARGDPEPWSGCAGCGTSRPCSYTALA